MADPKYFKDAFKNAERGAEGDVVLIRLQKPANEDSAFMAGATKRGRPTNTNTALAAPESNVFSGSQIKALVRGYEKALDSYTKAHMAVQQALSDIQMMSDHGSTFDLMKDSLSKGDANKFVKVFTLRCWHSVIGKMGLDKYFTEGVRKKFQQFQSETVSADFNVYNLQLLMDTILSQISTIQVQGVLEVFNKLCNHDAKNKKYMVEGWKTNSHYKINKKVIITWIFKFDSRWDTRPKLDYRARHQLDDIDRAMCFLTGIPYPLHPNQYTSLGDACERAANNYNESPEAHSTFFKVKAHKKGTLHIWFKQNFVLHGHMVDLNDLMNQFVAKERGWLPEDINN